MKTAPRTALFLVPLVCGAGLLGSHADAQPLRRPPVNKGAVVQSQVGLRTNIANLSTDVTSGGTANVATNGSLAGVPILNGFHFRFSNGDHEFQRLSLRPTSDQAANVAFRDRKADDRYKAQATWITLNGGGVKGEVASRSPYAAQSGPSASSTQGSYFVPLPTTRPPNHRLVLSGFEFRFPDGKDFGIRMIGLWLDEATNSARVTFTDSKISPLLGDGGPAMTDAKKGPILPSTDLDACSNKIASDKGGSLFSKDGYTSHDAQSCVRIQYAWIPDAAVAGQQAFSGTQRMPDSGAQFPARAGLQGFEFRYDSGAEHNLLTIGVMPPLPGAATRTVSGVPANELIQFQDKNRDDAIKWAAKMLIIR